MLFSVTIQFREFSEGMGGADVFLNGSFHYELYEIPDKYFEVKCLWYALGISEYRFCLHFC